ncbi:phosphotransferase [Pseudonocardia nigra]|uniref:phosphotransferase n=1 Tax=Pseudonocardia nigra TaxID=1921578 RepID=UPI0027E3AD06|nr:phosphotransferase [Pseudonocardia nigra]
MTTQHEDTAGHDVAATDELNESNARAALRAACPQVGLSAESAQLIRIGSNAVFRLYADHPVIARVARSTECLAEAFKQVAVSRWLQDAGYPATQALPIDQPVVAAGRVITFWKSVTDREEYAPIADVALLIRHLHDLAAPPADISLPALEPFGSAGAPLPRFDGLEVEDASYLTERLEWARATFPTLPFTLPQGHIHGDANVGNVLLTKDGSPVLIDLDSFAVGPREWDLIQTAIFADRLGWHTRDEYDTFVKVYGYDITTWDAYPLLAEMRELAMTSWLSRQASASERSAREAAKRVQALRVGGSRADWSPY